MQSPRANAARAVAPLEAEVAEVECQADDAVRAQDTARVWAMDRLSLIARFTADTLRDEARQLREAYDLEDDDHRYLNRYLNCS